jgi:hypothetical protein
MPEWFAAAVARPGVEWTVLVVRLVTAALFGLVVAAIHRHTRDPHRGARSFQGTLQLLCVIIAMVTQVIGDNVALAFSLVGALSIVRFRTAVHDTIDTAFVILAVAAGMAIGAGHGAVAAGGTAVAGAVAWLVRERGAARGAGSARSCLVEARLGWSPGAAERVHRALAAHDPHVECLTAGSAKKGALLAVGYRARLPREVSLAALAAELKAVDGVEAVDIRAGS